MRAESPGWLKAGLVHRRMPFYLRCRSGSHPEYKKGEGWTMIQSCLRDQFLFVSPPTPFVIVSAFSCRSPTLGGKVLKVDRSLLSEYAVKNHCHKTREEKHSDYAYTVESIFFITLMFHFILSWRCRIADSFVSFFARYSRKILLAASEIVIPKASA